ncbi:MAG TPA: ABC transporter permease, partial [Bacteroidales bacterium]|nr:ABC transporter permease [Bacteroidales bacterium]
GVNYRLPDKEAHVWKRVMEPKAWHDEYLRSQALREEGIVARTRLPARILKIPNLEVQLLIFSLRNFKCKFSKVNEVIKAVFIGPLIALLIGFLLRSANGDAYSLLDNRNLPLYQFLSVVVAIFLGLIASIDEIIGEQNILEKEQYQEFSRFSYLNSKILYLFPVVAFQILLYVLTGNYILEIKGMYLVYWLVLFSCACFGVLLGLTYSAAAKSREFMYKALLPLTIAVQLILGGGIISYDRLNLGHHKYTPLMGDLMVSRWGYEALAVEQFKNNAYEKLVYGDEKKLDQASFYNFYVIPEMQRAFTACFSSDRDTVKKNISLLQHEIKRAAALTGVYPFEYVNRMPEILKNEELAQELNGYITTYLASYYSDQFDTLSQKRSVRVAALTDSLGAARFDDLRRNYHNIALEQVVTNNQGEKAYKIVDNQIVRRSGMIYDTPDSKWGRAALFSPVKNFQFQETDTLWFNLAVIWFFTSICYIWVLFDFSASIASGFKLKV